MSPSLETLAFVFDRRGAWLALAWFAAPVIGFGIVLLIRLRRERPGPPRFSPALRVASFAVVTLAYFGVLYNWLFWRTFYNLSLDEGRGRAELTFLLPERTLSLPLAGLAAIRPEPSPKGIGRTLAIETRDGTVYRSPVVSRQEIAEILGKIKESHVSSQLVPP